MLDLVHEDLLPQLGDDVRTAMLAHAERECPREACGLLVRLQGTGALDYLAGGNLYVGTAGEDRFELDPMDWVHAEAMGEVVAVVHSHPNASANPSMADRRNCERSQLTWLVVGWPSGVIRQLQPSGWQAPYEGRTFHHGVLDCYSLVQDWFERELSEQLPDFERQDNWWRRGQDLYMRHFAEAGFVRVLGQPRRHDVPLVQVHSDVANHAAVCLGEGRMLHHLANRLSCEDVYGGYWQRHTLALVRHRSQLLPGDVTA